MTFHNYIAEENWDDVLKQRSSATLAYQAFLMKFQHCYDLAFPLRESVQKSKRIRKPWVTSELYRITKEKNRKFQHFLKTRDLCVLNEFKLRTN